MKQKRYEITEACVGCGSCKTICPTHCISKGMPYTIRQQTCKKCGLCLTRCWRKCIRVMDVDK